jgi:hypothetical protein
MIFNPCSANIYRQVPRFDNLSAPNLLQPVSYECKHPNSCRGNNTSNQGHGLRNSAYCPRHSRLRRLCNSTIILKYHQDRNRLLPGCNDKWRNILTSKGCWVSACHIHFSCLAGVRSHCYIWSQCTSYEDTLRPFTLCSCDI